MDEALTGVESPDQDELDTVARRWIEIIWRPGGLQHFDVLHSLDFIDHSPAGRGAGRDAYRTGIKELFAAFPDFSAVTEDLVLDPAGGKAAIRWSATGTQQGAFLGVPASGRVIHFAGIEIIQVQDGKITARWGEWDGLGLLAQMGEA